MLAIQVVTATLLPMTYVATQDRYERMPYRRCGTSGLKLPAVSLGLWQNFGECESSGAVAMAE